MYVSSSEDALVGASNIVHPLFVFHNWCWRNSTTPPTLEEITNQFEDLYKSCLKMVAEDPSEWCKVSCGRLYVSYTPPNELEGLDAEFDFGLSAITTYSPDMLWDEETE